MKAILLTSFIIIISLGICDAQTTTNLTTHNRQNTNAETITNSLKQKLNLSPIQTEKVQTIYQESLLQIQQVVESNNGDKHLANDQIQTLIQQRETTLQTILTPQQLTIYHSTNGK